MKDKILKIIYFFFIFGITSLVVGLLINFLIMPIVVDKGNERTLLSVKNLSWSEASSLLRREGFVPVRGETQAHPDLPPYTVLGQKPNAGQKVKLGRRVYLNLSVAEKNFPVPDLVGKTLRGAKLILEENSLVLDTVMYRYSTRPKDVIVNQFPEKGNMVPRSTDMQLWVSLGISPYYVVPDLVFTSEQSAVDNLEKAGLELGNIIYEYSEEFTPYTVISQSIDPGVEVRGKQKINIVVSKLPENIE